MAKTTVYIASRTEQENYILQKKLDSLEYEFSDLRFAGIHVAGLLRAVDRLTAAVILNLNEWAPKDAILIQELRRSGCVAPVLITAKANAAVVMRELHAAGDVTFLPKPFETKDMMGIVRKLLMARTVPQQLHRRFSTSQNAEIEVNGQKLVSHVRNLSKGGAFLEFLMPTTTIIGDFVSVKLELKDLKRTYTFPAKVVWTHKQGARGLGIGVEFTGRGEIVRSTIGF